MKTLYPLRNKPRTIFRQRFGLVILVFIIGAAIFSFVDGLFLRLAAPVWRGENILARNIWKLMDYSRSYDTLVKENQSLKESVASYKLQLQSQDVARVSEMSFQNTFARTSSAPGVLASVLVRPPQTLYDVLIVDVGTNNNIKVGDRVELPEGPHIGEVIEVFDKLSRIKLYSAWGEKINATLERDATNVVLSGRGGGNFEFTLPRETQVVTGDRVLSSNLEAALIGVIEHVEMAPTDSFKKILVGSVVHPQTLRYVIVRP